VDLPAGVVRVRMQVEASLPVAAVGRECVIANAVASFRIEPGHAELTYGSAACDGWLEGFPMWDGESMSLYAGPSRVGGVSCLVFGVQPTHLPLPLGAICPLAVDPLVVLPASGTTFTVVPVGRLGPVDLLVQGLVLQPSSPWSAEPRLSASAPARLVVH
jgi:hypothetical protein